MSVGNHLNQDHVHEVEGRESDSKVKAPGQGSLSRPQFHLLRLLEAVSHKVLRQSWRTGSTLYQVVQQQPPYLACQDDKLSRLPSVTANPGEFRLMPTKTSGCRHPPQPSSWSSERKYCMPASSFMPAISPLRNFSFSTLHSESPSCLLPPPPADALAPAYL